MKIKVFCLTALLVCVLSINSYAGTMYSIDGRKIDVPENEMKAYSQVGWYYAPVAIIYAPDGRTAVVPQSSVWRYENVGWYKNPAITMYSADGRRISVAIAEIQAYEAVGWYRNLSDVQKTLYAPNGNTIKVWLSEVESYIAVGWYYTPVKYLYSINGKSILVAESEVDAYKKVGWYEKNELDQIKKNSQAVNKFYKGQNVVSRVLFLQTKFGVVTDIDYSSGKVKVYWKKIIDANGNDITSNIFFGGYSETWVNASELSPSY